MVDVSHFFGFLLWLLCLGVVVPLTFHWGVLAGIGCLLLTVVSLPVFVFGISLLGAAIEDGLRAVGKRWKAWLGGPKSPY